MRIPSNGAQPVWSFTGPHQDPTNNFLDQQTLCLFVDEPGIFHFETDEGIYRLNLEQAGELLRVLGNAVYRQRAERATRDYALLFPLESKKDPED